MQRGEVWWAALPEPLGSGPGFRRPAVVIQSDRFNDSRINTVVVAIITSNLRRGAAPGNVTIAARESGLPKESVVNVSQIATLDRTLLTQRVSALSERTMIAVDHGLRLAVGL